MKSQIIYVVMRVSPNPVVLDSFHHWEDADNSCGAYEQEAKDNYQNDFVFGVQVSHLYE